jgi:hypothetical protein
MLPSRSIIASLTPWLWPFLARSLRDPNRPRRELEFVDVDSEWVTFQVCIEELNQIRDGDLPPSRRPHIVGHDGEPEPSPVRQPDLVVDIAVWTKMLQLTAVTINSIFDPLMVRSAVCIFGNHARTIAIGGEPVKRSNGLDRTYYSLPQQTPPPCVCNGDILHTTYILHYCKRER